MAPTQHWFETSKLSDQIQANLDGKKRKTEGGAKIDLSKCELRKLTQYECEVTQPEKPDSPVRCWPVPRYFRECRDKKGTFSVETTAWEAMQRRKRLTETQGDDSTQTSSK